MKEQPSPSWFSPRSVSNEFEGKQQVVRCAAEDSKWNFECWLTNASLALRCCVSICRNYKCSSSSMVVVPSSWTLQSEDPDTPMRPTCEGGMWLRPPVRQRAVQPPPLVLPRHFYSHVCTNTVRPVRTRQHCLRRVGISRELLHARTKDALWRQRLFFVFSSLLKASPAIASLASCQCREQWAAERERGGSLWHFSTKLVDSASSKTMSFAPSAGQQR